MNNQYIIWGGKTWYIQHWPHVYAALRKMYYQPKWFK